MKNHSNKIYRTGKIHMIGIGGVGMSGIAEVLLNLGYQVSGSDINKNNTTEKLSNLGAKINYQHNENNIDNIDIVVISSAIKPDNVEVVKAKEKNIPIIPRAKMLADLMRFSQGIAIAGTHGKTTTTSLITSILDKAGLDPTFVIGGQLNSTSSNACLGKGEYFVAEADESDASFLYLTPVMSVVTNIDKDHLGTYEDNFEKLKQSFIEFLNRLPFYGSAVVCSDDPEVNNILKDVCKPVITYGFNKNADIQAYDWQPNQNSSKFKVKLTNENSFFEVELNLAGKHNVLNSLAAIGIAKEIGIDNKHIISALKDFQGVGRRFQILGNYYLDNNVDEVTLIDDYGHHPKEINAVIEAIKSGWPGRRILTIFQPHRYSRTKSLLNEFAEVLSYVDVTMLLEVYSAGEDIIPGACSKSLCNEIKMKNNSIPIHITDKSKLFDKLIEVVKPGDIVLMQGAGDIGKLAKTIAEFFNNITKIQKTNII